MFSTIVPSYAIYVKHPLKSLRTVRTLRTELFVKPTVVLDFGAWRCRCQWHCPTKTWLAIKESYTPAMTSFSPVQQQQQQQQYLTYIPWLMVCVYRPIDAVNATVQMTSISAYVIVKAQPKRSASPIIVPSRHIRVYV